MRESLLPVPFPPPRFFGTFFSSDFKGKEAPQCPVRMAVAMTSVAGQTRRAREEPRRQCLVSFGAHSFTTGTEHPAK